MEHRRRLRRLVGGLVAPTTSQGWERYARLHTGPEPLGDEWNEPEAIGIDVAPGEIVAFLDREVFAPFEAATDYFGSETQQTMLNFRVRDLDAMLAQLRARGADVADDVQEMAGVGRFGWVTDPEGHRVELWQPA